MLCQFVGYRWSNWIHINKTKLTASQWLRFVYDAETLLVNQGELNPDVVTPVRFQYHTHSGRVNKRGNSFLHVVEMLYDITKILKTRHILFCFFSEFQCGLHCHERYKRNWYCNDSRIESRRTAESVPTCPPPSVPGVVSVKAVLVFVLDLSLIHI